jgi:hypothetical protein
MPEMAIVREDDLDRDVVRKLEWLSEILRRHPELAKTVEDGRASLRFGVTLVVFGGPAEVQLWHQVTGGRIRPHVSHHGDWSQLILSPSLCITVHHAEVAA